MTWNFDDSEARNNYLKGKHIPVPSAGMRKYNDWKRRILSSAHKEHPKDAAKYAGDMHYEKVGDVYTIRLTQEHRVVFKLNDTLKKITVIRIGGHYP